MKTLIPLLLLSACLSAQTQSTPPSDQSPTTATEAKPKIDPEKEADIRHLMEEAGTKALMAQMMGGMETSLKPMVSNAFPPGEYREKLIDLFIAKFKSEGNLQQLLDLIVPIYDKYFSDREIKDLIKYYQTPLGQKTIAVMPKLFAESQEAGQKWGEALGRQAMIDVLAEHPEFKKAMEDARNPPELK